MFDVVLPELRVKGAHTIGILAPDIPIHYETKEGIRKQGKNHKLEIICEAVIPFLFAPPTDIENQMTYEAVLQMMECDPDVWILLGNSVRPFVYFTTNFIIHVRKRNRLNLF